MKIDLNAINREQFNVKAVDGGRVLILPQPTKHRWTPDEVHLRSLLCGADGEVLSSGLPKFLNYGEDEWHDRITEQCFASGRHEIADKLDGSLIIRSVIDGEVHWRTRGMPTIAPDFWRMLREVDADWEGLDDPQYGVGESLLFELTHPENHIVLRYNEPRLTALGFIDLDDLRPCLSQVEAQRIAEAFDLWAPEYFPAQSDADALTMIAQDRLGAEGFVCQMWTAKGTPHLVKFKSAEYVKLHSLKQHASPEKISRLAYQYGADSLDEFKAAMHSQGFDWEAVSFMEPAALEHFERVDIVNAGLLAFDHSLDASGLLDAETMKAKAVGLKAMCAERGTPSLFNYGIRVLRGQPDAARDEADAMRHGVTVSQLRAWRTPQS